MFPKRFVKILSTLIYFMFMFGVLFSEIRNTTVPSARVAYNYRLYVES